MSDCIWSCISKHDQVVVHAWKTMMVFRNPVPKDTRYMHTMGISKPIINTCNILKAKPEVEVSWELISSWYLISHNILVPSPLYRWWMLIHHLCFHAIPKEIWHSWTGWIMKTLGRDYENIPHAWRVKNMICQETKAIWSNYLNSSRLNQLK